MRNIRLFWQIYPVGFGIAVLSLLLCTWLAISEGRQFYINQLNQEIRERALLIEPSITRLSMDSPEELQRYVRFTGRRASTRITVIDQDGTVLADSNEDHRLMENHAKRPEVSQALGGETGYSLRYSATLGYSMLYAAIPVELLQDDHRGVLRLAIPLSSLEESISIFKNKILATGIGVALLAAILAWFSGRRISRPLEQMKRGAEQLTQGRIDQLVQIDSEHMSVEMAGLAASINKMAEQINRRIRIIIQQRNELEAVFSSMADAVVAIDSDRKVMRMNQTATDLFAMPSEVVKGKVVDGIIRNPQILALVDATLSHNSQQEQRVTLYQGQEPTILQTHAVPLRDEGNLSIGVLLVMNDLTKLDRLENIRQDFVANVSHELKTPITAIKGYVETLLDGALDDQDNARRFLKIVDRQASRLDAIIDDLLTLSRIENHESSNAIELRVDKIGPVLESALQTCAVNADEKEIIIQVECDEDLLAPINQALLEQALVNLLKNAIAYSPEGSLITMGCCCSKNMQGGAFVHLSISDNGPGIAKEHLPRLFERFYRCDKARSRDLGGTGLGLAIVKHIAQAHNGTVEVESSQGQGSTFTITLPSAGQLP